MALGVFYLAIPLGAAMGYAVGGILGETMGWRKAFLFCGVPGPSFAPSLRPSVNQHNNNSYHQGESEERTALCVSPHPAPSLLSVHLSIHPSPGLVVAFLVLLIQDPPRGINDEPAPEHAAMTEAEALAATRAKGQWDDYKTIFTNPYFMYGLAGVTANCFCL